VAGVFSIEKVNFCFTGELNSDMITSFTEIRYLISTILRSAYA
jgi:hypothetical protein